MFETIALSTFSGVLGSAIFAAVCLAARKRILKMDENRREQNSKEFIEAAKDTDDRDYFFRNIAILCCKASKAFLIAMTIISLNIMTMLIYIVQRGENMLYSMLTVALVHFGLYVFCHLHLDAVEGRIRLASILHEAVNKQHHDKIEH